MEHEAGINLHVRNEERRLEWEGRHQRLATAENQLRTIPSHNLTFFLLSVSVRAPCSVFHVFSLQVEETTPLYRVKEMLASTMGWQHPHLIQICHHNAEIQHNYFSTLVQCGITPDDPNVVARTLSTKEQMLMDVDKSKSYLKILAQLANAVNKMLSNVQDIQVTQSYEKFMDQVIEDVKERLREVDVTGSGSKARKNKTQGEEVLEQQQAANGNLDSITVSRRSLPGYRA